MVMNIFFQKEDFIENVMYVPLWNHELDHLDEYEN